MLSRLAIVIALLGVGCKAHLRPSPDAQKIVELEIAGTELLSEGEIKKRIASTKSHLLQSYWFDASAWQADLQRVVRIYEAEGIFGTRVIEDKVDESEPGRVKLFIRVAEGTPVKIASLELPGLEDVDPSLRDKIKADLPLEIGEQFKEEDWARAKDTLVHRLREVGYAEAEVEGEALVDPSAGTAALTLLLRPGTRFKFGKLLPANEADAQVPNNILVEMVSLEVVPGEWYSESALARAQQRLFSMGVFSAVKVTRTASEGGLMPVQIDVREAPYRTVRMGPGLGLDRLRQEVRGIFEYTHRNIGFSRLFNRNAVLDRFTFRGKLGWAFLAQGASTAAGIPNGPIARLLFEYEVPRLGGIRTLSLQNSVDLQRTIDLAYSAWSAELRTAPVWRPHNDVSITPIGFTGSVFGLQSSAPIVTTAPTAALGCPHLPVWCVLGALDSRIEWDRRNDKLEPSRGTFASLMVQGGLYSSDVVTPFLKLLAETRGYIELGPVVLAGRLAAGTIFSTSVNTPIVARFFSGGSTMRGFYQRRLSPMATYGSELTVADYEARGETPRRAQELVIECRQNPRPDCRNLANGIAVPIGGNGLLEANFELKVNVWGPIVVALFNDYGVVTTEPLGRVNPFTLLYTAIGLGVRYRSPIGPIRVDFAYRLPMVGPRLPRQSLDVGEVTVPSTRGCLFNYNLEQDPNYAGAPDNVCSIHISIGEAF